MRDPVRFEAAIADFKLRQAARIEKREAQRAKVELQRQAKLEAARQKLEAARQKLEAPPADPGIPIRCEKCHRMFTEVQLKAHKYRCGARVPLAHNFCGCGRIKPSKARTCFRCETLDPGMEWMRSAESDKARPVHA